MEIFSIIVGVATIIGALCSIISVIFLNSLNNQIKNNGNNNETSIQYNRGKGNRIYKR